MVEVVEDLYEDSYQSDEEAVSKMKKNLTQTPRVASERMGRKTFKPNSRRSPIRQSIKAASRKDSETLFNNNLFSGDNE